MLLGDGLHLRILRKTAHVEAANAAIACSADHAAHQLRADTLVLVRLFNGEGRFCLLAPGIAEPAQLGGAAHMAVDDLAIYDAAELRHAAGVVLDESVRHGMRETQPPAVLIQ